jgi:hypothetical protein
MSLTHLFTNLNEVIRSIDKVELNIQHVKGEKNFVLEQNITYFEHKYSLKDLYSKTNYYTIFKKIENEKNKIPTQNLLENLFLIFSIGIFEFEFTQIIDSFIAFLKKFKNYNMLKQICEKGIELEHANSALELAIFYRDREKNFNKMKENLLKAYELGDLYSIFILAYELDKKKLKRESAINYQLFIDEFNKKYPCKNSKLSNAPTNLFDNYLCACHNLGLYFLYDNFHADNLKKYLNFGIEFNSSICGYLLGCYYRDIEPNIRLMKKCYDIGVKNNHAESILDLADFYLNAENNIEEAKKYYKLLISLNNVNAIIKLAIIYETENNYVEAINYYLRATRLNNKNSYFKLADIYKEKLNDNMNAIQILLECISKFNDTEAMIDLGMIYKDINDIDKFKTYMNLAIENKNYDGFYYLGEYYEKINEIEKAFNNYLMGKRSNDRDCDEKISISSDFFKNNVHRILNYCLTKFKEYSLMNFLTNQKIKTLRNIYFQNSKKCYFYLINITHELEVKSVDQDFINELLILNSSLFKEIKLDKPDECPILYEEVNIMYQTKCKHNFSRIILFMNIQTCPMCRQNLK